MNRPNELHNAAMDKAELALLARYRRDFESAECLLKESLELELKAIEAVKQLDPPNPEPTFSVLHRSAATLALDSNNTRLAEKLIAEALAADPPDEISEELRDLMEQVHFFRHLELRGISLAEDELQMSLAGQGVGYGMVHYLEFLDRIEYTSKILGRIGERRQNLPYREKGPAKQSIKEDFELFVSIPRAASFAVTLKVGRTMEQLKLPGILDTKEVVDEFLELIEMFNKDDFNSIKKRIPDTAYRTNFVQLAKRMAPDGNNVRVVGFTALRGNKTRYVQFTKPKASIDIPEERGIETTKQTEMVTVSGILKFADALRSESNRIKVVEAIKKKSHLIQVPVGMMNDIVKPLWGSQVVVTGVREGNIIHLKDIEVQQD